jgi:hypothetical protein
VFRYGRTADCFLAVGYKAVTAALINPVTVSNPSEFNGKKNDFG